MVLQIGGAVFRPLGDEFAGDVELWVDQNGRTLSQRVWLAGEGVRQQIDKRLRLAIVRGDDPIQVARELEQYLSPSWAPKRNEKGRLEADQPKRIVTRTPRSGAGSYPARRLARTEITRAFGQASIEAARLNPFVRGVKWSLSGVHKDSDQCDDNARRSSRGLPRGVYLVDDVPRYPNHPQCFPDGVLVQTANGERPIESVAVGDSVLTHTGQFRCVLECFEREYCGPLVRIVLDEREFLVTPEHPLLTEHGWVEAACLQPGDNLCRAGVGMRHDSFVGKVQYLPSHLTQFFIACGFGGDIGVPLRSIAFNDKTCCGNDEIGPTFADAMPMLGNDANLEQGILHDSFNLAASVRFCHPVIDVAGWIRRDGGTFDSTHLRSHVGALCGIVDSLGGTDLCTNFGSLGGIVVSAEVEAAHGFTECYGSDGATFGGPCLADAFGYRPHRNVESIEKTTKHAESDAELSAQHFCRDAIDEVATRQDYGAWFCGDGFNTSDMSVLRVATVAESVLSFVRHVEIIEDFHGMVRNLEVDQDATFAVEGVIVHNCRCVLSPFVDQDTASVVAQLRRDFDLEPPRIRLVTVSPSGRLREKVVALFRIAKQLLGKEAA